MSIMIMIAMIVALFFAMNIGASGTAASMGAAYGGGAIKRKSTALILVAIAVFLGAYFGGGEVVKTISHGIIPSQILTVELTIAIIASACLTLFAANVLAIPLSTSEVTVGAVVGVGIAYRSLFLVKVLLILATWIAMPFLAFGIAYGLAKLIDPIERRLQLHKSPLLLRILTLVLILSGVYEAFSAGMNNVANAVGPLVGAGLLDSPHAILWGGVFVSIGVLAMGGRVLDTNAKKITELSLMKSSAVSLTSGTLVVVASVFGIPVPMTQATTMAIFGIGTVDHGRGFWRSPIVAKVIKVWILSPIISLVVSYATVEIVFLGQWIGILSLVLLIAIYVGYRSFNKSKAVVEKSM